VRRAKSRLGGPRAGSGAVHVQAMRRKATDVLRRLRPHTIAVDRRSRGSRNRIALLSCRFDEDGANCERSSKIVGAEANEREYRKEANARHTLVYKQLLKKSPARGGASLQENPKASGRQRESSDNPILNAFWRVAPSVRFNFLAIRPAGVFLRAIVFSSRTCADVQARLFDPFFMRNSV
jgi:hypothetical protein